MKYGATPAKKKYRLFKQWEKTPQGATETWVIYPVSKTKPKVPLTPVFPVVRGSQDILKVSFHPFPPESLEDILKRLERVLPYHELMKTKGIFLQKNGKRRTIYYDGREFAIDEREF